MLAQQKILEDCGMQVRSDHAGTVRSCVEVEGGLWHAGKVRSCVEVQVRFRANTLPLNQPLKKWHYLPVTPYPALPSIALNSPYSCFDLILRRLV
jgi:hypothetical protein